MAHGVHTWKILDTESRLTTVLPLHWCQEYNKPPSLFEYSSQLFQIKSLFPLTKLFLGANICFTPNIILRQEYHHYSGFQKDRHRREGVG